LVDCGAHDAELGSSLFIVSVILGSLGRQCLNPRLIGSARQPYSMGGEDKPCGSRGVELSFEQGDR
jgi:hypothetical protein